MLTRRALIQNSGLILGSAAAAAPLQAADDAAAKPQPNSLKIVVAGGHPDDPESACGGTMARYAELGHDVVALYLTRGESGIKGKSRQEAGQIRTAEAEKACEILRARPVFATQIDGQTELTAARYDDVRKIIEDENPDVVFTHWPIDQHRDHRATSLLVFDAWLKLDRKFTLYYFEVVTGDQTRMFHPDYFTDITKTEDRKREAVMAHASQKPEKWYEKEHGLMNQFRGMQFGCKLAEAFVHQERSPFSPLPN